MRSRLAFVSALVAVMFSGVVVAQSSSPSSYSGADLTCTNAAAGDGWIALAAKVGAPSGLALANQEGGTLNATVRVGQRVCWAASPDAPTTTIPPTTIPPTTIPPTTAPPTTVAPPTSTTPPPAAEFVETFDTPDAIDRFGWHVYHRNVDRHNFWGFSGGTWTGDHDLSCGPPSTQRSLQFTPGDSQEVRKANSVYHCNGHVMTAMGDVDGYSIVSFSPSQTFDNVSSVCVDVNLTDLGTRQWVKIGVVTDALYGSTVNGVPGFLVSDVPAADVPTSLATANRLVASWSGGVSAGHPGGLKIGNTATDVTSNPSPNDKTTRHPVCLIDNGDGTVTFTVAGTSVTRPGSFPAGPKRVVFYDHNYTPTKSESGYPQGFTWHWDNVVVS